MLRKLPLTRHLLLSLCLTTVTAAARADYDIIQTYTPSTTAYLTWDFGYDPGTTTGYVGIPDYSVTNQIGLGLNVTEAGTTAYSGNVNVTTFAAPSTLLYPGDVVNSAVFSVSSIDVQWGTPVYANYSCGNITDSVGAGFCNSPNLVDNNADLSGSPTDTATIANYTVGFNNGTLSSPLGAGDQLDLLALINSVDPILGSLDLTFGQYSLADNNALSYAGTLNVPLPSSPMAYTVSFPYTVTYNATLDIGVTSTYDTPFSMPPLAPTPEPATWTFALLGTAFVPVFLQRRRVIPNA